MNEKRTPKTEATEERERMTRTVAPPAQATARMTGFTSKTVNLNNDRTQERYETALEKPP